MDTLPNLKFYTDACKYMRSFLRSMNILGMNNIEHDITFGDGQISMLTPDLEMIKFYNKTKTPIAYTDTSGRFLKEGIYLNKVVESQYPQYSKLMPLFLRSAKEMNLSYGENYIHYVIKEVDCQHMYTLFFDLSYNDFLHFIINNGNLIKETIEEYHQQAKDLIAEAKFIENRIILPDMSQFVSQDISSNFNNKHIYVFHKHSGLLAHLSPQRGQCLLHLVQGKSVKEISRAMKLTPKTIEYYLDLLRKELGCRTSKELIAYYSEQLLHTGISLY